MAAVRQGGKVEDKSENVLDEVVWNHVVSMVRAAHGQSHAEYVDRMNELAREGRPRQRVAWLYVWFILRHAVGGVIQWRVPSDEDLARISHDYIDGFRALVGGGQPTFEDLLRTAWERTPRIKKLSIGEQLAFGGAAIGILLQDPEHAMGFIKPRLNEWWLKYADNFLRKGLTIDDSPVGGAGGNAPAPGSPGNSTGQAVTGAPGQRSRLAPDVVASLRQVHALTAQGHFDEAARAAEQALALDPDSPRVRQALALARYLAGDLPGTREAILGVLRDPPDRDYLRLLEMNIREDGVRAELADVYEMIQAALDADAGPEDQGLARQPALHPTLAPSGIGPGS